MKHYRNLKILTVSLLGLMMTQVQAHLPFLAPQSYVVDGESATAIGGFAEQAFAAEVALRNFNMQVIQPNGDVQHLTSEGTPYLTVADIKTAQPGTYQLQAVRQQQLQFAQVNGRWLRVMSVHGVQTTPLAERQFITPEEVTATMQTVNTVRQEQLLSYFSKGKTTPLIHQNNDLLQVKWDVHPNQLKVGQVVIFTLQQQQKAQKNFTALITRQKTTINEPDIHFKAQSDTQGRIAVTFPQAGQYLIQIDSPQNDEKSIPSDTQRIMIAVQVTA